MAKSDLRLLLEDEFAALAEPMRTLEHEARDFWAHPDEPALRVWADFTTIGQTPEPSAGSVSERELYRQLTEQVKPTLQSRRYGSDCVPMIYPHDKHYQGPPFRTHFLAVVMGGEVVYPPDVPVHERMGYRAWVKPLVRDVSEIDALEDVDVSQSPALQAVLRSYEEMGEIVQGIVPITHYSPTLPLDFAADVAGPTRFYEMLGGEPEAAARLLDICTRKWFEMMSLQEKAAGGRWVNAHYEPGLSAGDMILPYLSPKTIRDVVLPYNARLSAHYGEIVVGIGHPDPSLLEEYLQLPGVRGVSVHPDWPAEPVVDALRDKIVLRIGFDWHYHPGQKPRPTCIPWDECLRRLAEFAGKLRVEVSVSCRGETPEETRRLLLQDVEDIHNVWSDS